MAPAHFRAVRQSAISVALTLCAMALTHCGTSSGGGSTEATGDGATDATSGTDAKSEGSTMDGPPAPDATDASDGSDATTLDAPADTLPESAVDAGGEDGGSDSSGDASDGAVACDAADACSGALACCSGFCADLGHDPRNCGACGNACTLTQFCTGTQCDDAVFSNVAVNTSITVVEDPYPIDIEAGVAIGTVVALAADAGLTVVPQTQSGVLVPVGDAGWRPNTGVGTTLVAGGSWFGQLSVAYMDNTGLTPVYLTNDGTTSHIYQRATGLALVTAADSSLTNSHDFFILELAVEPQSGTLCLFGQGILGMGTVAAGYWGSQVIVPNRTSYTAPWYVYEWTDSNNDGTAGAGDTFDLIAQGP